MIGCSGQQWDAGAPQAARQLQTAGSALAYEDHEAVYRQHMARSAACGLVVVLCCCPTPWSRGSLQGQAAPSPLTTIVQAGLILGRRNPMP